MNQENNNPAPKDNEKTEVIDETQTPEWRIKIKKQHMDAKKKKRMKLISSIILLVALSVLVVTLFLNLGDISAISHTFHEIANGKNWVWLVYTLLVEIFFFMTWPLALMVMGKGLNCEATPGEVFLIGASEHFYSGVTPSASGGQPFQVYSLTSRNVSSSKATGMIMMTYFTQLIATNIFSFVSLIYYPHYVQALSGLDIPWMQWVIVAGFILNAWNMFFVFLLGTSKKIRSFLIWCFALLCKIGFVKKKFGKYMDNFINYIDETQAVFKECTKHRKEFLISLFLRCVSNFANYSITFFLMKSVGMPIGWDKFFLITLSTSFTLSSVAWVPTPGATGGIEYAFSIIIYSVMDSSIGLSNAQALILLYRLFTYYLILFVSLFCSMLLQGITNNRLSKEARDLEIENSYDEKKAEKAMKEEAEKKTAIPINEEDAQTDKEESTII